MTPESGEDFSGTAEYQIWNSGFENIFGNNYMASPYTMDSLKYDSSTTGLSYSSSYSFDSDDPGGPSDPTNDEDNGGGGDDPGGPSDPTNDTPVNGGLCILLTTGLGAGYRSFRRRNDTSVVMAI